MPEPLEGTSAETAPTTDTTTAPVADATATTSTDEPTSYSADYVRELRRENAKYRERAKAGETYAEVFGGYEEADRAAWLDLGKAWKEDPARAAEQMQRIAQAALDRYAEQRAEDDQPLTRAEYRAMQEAAQKQAAEQADQARIEREATDLGYEKGTLDYKMLLLAASELPNGSLKDAHAAIKAREEKAIADFLARKQSDAESGPKPPAGSGSAPSTERKVEGWNGARASLEARIAAAASRK